MMLLCCLLLAGAVAAQRVQINGVTYQVETMHELSDDVKQSLRQPVQSKIEQLESQVDATDDVSEKAGLCNTLAVLQGILSQLEPSDRYHVVDHSGALLH